MSGIVLTELLGEKPYPSATLSTTNLTQIGQQSNPGLYGNSSATNRHNHGTDFEDCNNSALYIKIQFVPHTEHSVLPLQRQTS
jgi:hypothetical protein